MKKTAIQEAINELISKAKAEQYKTTTYWNYIECINILDSKLEKEKEDLIDACQTGINKALDYSFEPQDYYNQTFKQ